MRSPSLGSLNHALARFSRRHPQLTLGSLEEVIERVTSAPLTYPLASDFLPLPLLVPAPAWTSLRTTTIRLVGLVDRLAREILTGDGAAAATLGLDEHWVHRGRDVLDSTLPSTMARPDWLLATRPLLLEANVDSSLGGLGTADALSDVVMTSPLLQRFADSHSLELAAEANVASSLSSLVREVVSRLPHRPGQRQRPMLAIVDWVDELSSVPHPYERLAEGLTKQGIDVVIAPPEALAWDGQALSCSGSVVHCVFRGNMTDDRYLANRAALAPAEAASAAGATVVLTPVGAASWSSKRLLGVLSERADDGDLTDSDARFVRRVLPWSRLLAERKTSYRGEPIDLVPFVADQQATLVLKAANGGSSAQVTIGAETPAEEWSRVLAHHLERGDGMVQEYVDPPVQDLIVLEDGGPRLVRSCWNASVFLLGSRTAGSCIRALPTTAHRRISCMLGAREGVVATVGPK